jgi:hypothetical protein
MSTYTAVAERAAARIRKKGGPVVFTTTTGRVYDPDAGTWTGGAPVTATSHAVQDEDDPELFRALGLTLHDPVTLLVAAQGLSFRPVADMAMSWGGLIYTVKACEALKPDGVTPITYTVIGDR